ncbi:glycoside hydrolase family 65 protein [Companilactobacillus nuruki]|uniref:Glycosyl hydrolase n=1 Tax=Companilactobacillus nuruki TaxID=1993540 RepID=A0A2N7ATS6_9LACO|nr:glycosyl hydrolase family 65 protein [Companilactobacillus nuruki]PMD69859.1 glycosyl hydrolase [Companilactobacillus nuruki]
MSNSISLNDLKSRDPSYLETIFSLANGHFGIRASDPIIGSDTAGTVVNGFYEISKIIYGEKAFGYADNNQTIVKLPDLRTINIYDNQGNKFDISNLKTESLNMNTGLLTSTYELSNNISGKTIELTVNSTLQQSDNQMVGLRYEIKPLSYSGNIKLTKHLNIVASVDTVGDPRRAKAVKTLEYQKDNPNSHQEILTTTTKKSKMSLQMAIYAKDSLEKEYDLSNGKVVFDVIGVVSEPNGKVSTNDLPSFEKIVNDSTNFWSDFWERSEVKITGDDSLNQALHFNLFQLTSSSGRDGKTNISAKGLSGTGYDGHYFWDTEMYMSPFFTYTNPEIAKNLIKYRYSILEDSKKTARAAGVDEGVLFPWRTIGGPEASSYFPAGTAQYHINADISYAVARYYRATNDEDLIKKYGMEIIIETARFWNSLGSYSKINGKDQFCFFDVTGPDEYTAIVNNNYYTNRMAKFNLGFAVELIDKFPEKATELGVTTEERNNFLKESKSIYLPYDSEKKINEQDDSAFNKPIWPFETTPKENYPLLLHYHPLRIYRYQVNKQADTLLADFLFDDITKEQLIREYDYYEKITTHDSSLSRSIFSALAARIGLKNKAYSYFMDTVKTDLIDLQKNTQDGLHIANLGGSWLTVVSGFGGLQVKNGSLTIANHLPDEWKKLSIRLQFQGRLLEINYLPSKIDVSILSGEPLKIIVDGVCRKDS